MSRIDRKLPRTAPLGQLDALRQRPDAHLIGYSAPRSAFGEFYLTLYKSREALAAFAKADSIHHALVKDATPANLVTNRNMQRATR